MVANAQRLLGHEDLTPISRHDKKGGWDPGGLREVPYFDWEHVYRTIEKLTQVPQVQEAFTDQYAIYSGEVDEEQDEFALEATLEGEDTPSG